MGSWSFRDYQEELSGDALSILEQYHLVYLAMEERTGKTGTAIATANKYKAKRVLVVTKAGLVGDWQEQLAKFPTDFKYVVISYHSVHKAPSNCDLVLLDESHNFISSSPKMSKMWKAIYKKIFGAPIIYISATPHAQGYQMLFHQFKLSKLGNPWKNYKDYYRWYEDYAVRDSKNKTEEVWTGGRMSKTYKTVKDDVIRADTDHLFITKTRKELGFPYEPKDKVHYVTLDESTLTALNLLTKNRVLKFNFKGETISYIADTIPALRVALHQLEGGTLIIRPDEEDLTRRKSLILKSTAKIDYILKTFGDDTNMVIMYNFKAEEVKLKQHFKKALVVQATTHAEGKDYYDREHLIIYSQDYSSARHTQRRARQASKSRESEIIVHHILVKNGISDQVYTTVCLNKQNFVDSRFKIQRIGV